MCPPEPENKQVSDFRFFFRMIQKDLEEFYTLHQYKLLSLEKNKCRPKSFIGTTIFRDFVSIKVVITLFSFQDLRGPHCNKL